MKKKQTGSISYPLVSNLKLLSMRKKFNIKTSSVCWTLELPNYHPLLVFFMFILQSAGEYKGFFSRSRALVLP